MKRTIIMGLMAIALPASVALANVSEDRDVEDFHKIKLDGLMDATITVGKDTNVTISAGKDRYLDQIKTSVRDGMLYIEMDDDDGFFSVFRNYEVKVTISVPSLDYIEMDGLGDVDVTGVDSEDFRLILDGLGSIKIDGTCGRADIVLDGMGDLKGRDFKCKEVRLVLDGMGDATIYASDYADVNLDGFGDVDVYGDPKDTRFIQDGMGNIDVH